MPREIALLDALMPTLILAFIAALLLYWLLDKVLVWLGVYQFIWYRALFRLSLFSCLFCALGLLIY
ncbi:Protein of unknown function [Methylobacillus rhizosphaerae]|uniref:DUF1656 domain-containing protein n=1 Tax=Methylobacillus rhizosphaerae TaxID=551994 RepID=A0A238ZBM8_9PROT|nr:DUF1656 domain-containing protein [Methylobacillus rhizosphaerae]SNR80492.1 Protein of unknown function [Methylobacillus rhizosphaerae]